jgi:hypothetical protein
MARFAFTIPEPKPAPAPVESGGLRVPPGYAPAGVPSDPPKGARAAWTNGVRIVITGEPGNGDERDPEYEAHNCDFMGCGWDHVLEVREVPK